MDGWREKKTEEERKWGVGWGSTQNGGMKVSGKRKGGRKGRKKSDSVNKQRWKAEREEDANEEKSREGGETWDDREVRVEEKVK